MWAWELWPLVAILLSRGGGHGSSRVDSSIGSCGGVQQAGHEAALEGEQRLLQAGTGLASNVEEDGCHGGISWHTNCGREGE